MNPHADPECMSCAEVDQLLPLVADAVVDAESDPALFAHLARCQTCQTALACHDLVTLALATTAPPRRAATLNVVHYRLPRRWIAAAAAAVLAVVGFGAALTLAPDSSASSQFAQQEIIHVINPADGRQRPMLLIRQGTQSTLVDPESFDQLRGAHETTDARAVPVRMRY